MDILSELDDLAPPPPDPRPPSAATPTLQPQVMTASDLAEQQRTARASEEIVRASAADPYADQENLTRLVKEYEKMQEVVDSFAKDKTSFDSIWRELNESCRRTEAGMVSVARCYVVKNREQDVVPYDKNR